MTREEIIQKIATLKEESFNIEVSSDYLTQWQMKRIGEIAKEINSLNEQLTTMEEAND